MDKEKEILDFLKNVNSYYYEQSKSYPDKTKRKMFLYYCSAVTSVTIEIEKILKSK